MPEYYNPNGHTVHLVGPDGQTVKMVSGQRRNLPEFFERYVAKGYIRRADQGGAPGAAPHKRIGRSTQKLVQNNPQNNNQNSNQRSQQRPASVRGPAHNPPAHSTQNKNAVPSKAKQRRIARRPVAPQKDTNRVVGRRLNEDATQRLRSNLQGVFYPVSNGIGVGILSYNRWQSLRRLIESIRRHTDLKRTTVFVSDDASDDPATKSYLDGLQAFGDIVVIRNDKRLGVAGNTNRLMRCLARFNSCLILNDDVEVLADGWDDLYGRAARTCRIKHFCMRQPGVYGAKPGAAITHDGVDLTVVHDRPHGAIIAYSRDVFDVVGYFDESFGLYGMEHVDWSNRVVASGLQPSGYYDLPNSHDYFVIHNEHSAVDGREALLASARSVYQSMNPARGYVGASAASAVPSVSVVIPCRDVERHGAIATVVAGMRGQRFPVIEIIVSEHDEARRVFDDSGPIKSIHIQSAGKPFNKSMAFNAGVAQASHHYLVLHDADLLMHSMYIDSVYNKLQTHDACHLGKSVLYMTHESSNLVNASGVVPVDVECERVVGYFEGGSLGCRRSVYWRVGGFNQDFWGYGVEDCEFYNRLSSNCNWAEDRRFDFVHMWHGRSHGWQDEHVRNKELGERIYADSMQQRLQNMYANLRRDGYGNQLDAALKGTI